MVVWGSKYIQTYVPRVIIIIVIVATRRAIVRKDKPRVRILPRGTPYVIRLFTFPPTKMLRPFVASSRQVRVLAAQKSTQFWILKLESRSLGREHLWGVGTVLYGATSVHSIPKRGNDWHRSQLDVVSSMPRLLLRVYLVVRSTLLLHPGAHVAVCLKPIRYEGVALWKYEPRKWTSLESLFYVEISTGDSNNWLSQTIKSPPFCSVRDCLCNNKNYQVCLRLWAKTTLSMHTSKIRSQSKFFKNIIILRHDSCKSANYQGLPRDFSRGSWGSRWIYHNRVTNEN